MLKVWLYTLYLLEVIISNFETKFKNLAVVGVFLPGINEVKKTIIDPDAGPDFFIYADKLGLCTFISMPHRGIMKLPVLS